MFKWLRLVYAADYHAVIAALCKFTVRFNALAECSFVLMADLRNGSLHTPSVPCVFVTAADVLEHLSVLHELDHWDPATAAKSRFPEIVQFGIICCILCTTSEDLGTPPDLLWGPPTNPTPCVRGFLTRDKSSRNVKLLPLWLSFGFLPVLPCTVTFAVSRLLHCILLKQNQLLEFGNLSYLQFDSYAPSQSVQINI